MKSQPHLGRRERQIMDAIYSKGEGSGPFAGGGTIGLKKFADEHRAYLLEHPEVKRTSSPSL